MIQGGVFKVVVKAETFYGQIKFYKNFPTF